LLLSFTFEGGNNDALDEDGLCLVGCRHHRFDVALGDRNKWNGASKMTELDGEPCGEVHEIDPEILTGYDNRARVICWGAMLICSRPLNHTPANQHSDGVTDWIGDEE
jgi:hypothetical protein